MRARYEVPEEANRLLEIANNEYQKLWGLYSKLLIEVGVDYRDVFPLLDKAFRGSPTKPLPRAIPWRASK